MGTACECTHTLKCHWNLKYHGSLYVGNITLLLKKQKSGNRSGEKDELFCYPHLICFLMKFYSFQMTLCFSQLFHVYHSCDRGWQSNARQHDQKRTGWQQNSLAGRHWGRSESCLDTDPSCCLLWKLLCKSEIVVVAILKSEQLGLPSEILTRVDIPLWKQRWRGRGWGPSPSWGHM